MVTGWRCTLSLFNYTNSPVTKTFIPMWKRSWWSDELFTKYYSNEEHLRILVLFFFYLESDPYPPWGYVNLRKPMLKFSWCSWCSWYPCYMFIWFSILRRLAHLSTGAFRASSPVSVLPSPPQSRTMSISLPTPHQSTCQTHSPNLTPDQTLFYQTCTTLKKTGNKLFCSLFYIILC